jgi:hypothetical protein
MCVCDRSVEVVSVPSELVLGLLTSLRDSVLRAAEADTAMREV